MPKWSARHGSTATLKNLAACIRAADARGTTACRERATIRRATIQLGCSSIVFPACRFPAAYDTFSLQVAPACRYKRALILLAIPFQVRDNPVASLVQEVSEFRVGEQQGELPIATLPLYDGQPGFTFRVVSLGNDLPPSVVLIHHSGTLDGGLLIE
jgi:hypothetical protein